MTVNRVYEIDLLRFFAALSVVFFHYSFRGFAADNMTIMPYPLAPVAKYGYLGVELFFLISGFVIMMTASSGSLRSFIVSRMVRLYPAFWACCTITFLVILLIGGERYSASLSQYLINMTMLSGFIGVPSIDGVYWSLFVEMKFYALIALVLLCKQINRIELLLIIWLFVALCLDIFPVGVIRSLLITESAPYFIAGAMFFLMYSKGISIIRALTVFVALGMSIFHLIEPITFLSKNFNTNFDGRVIAGMILVS